MNNIHFTLLISFIALIPLTAFLPYFTRKTENFGVSIPQSFYDRDDFKLMRKQYAIYSSLLGLISLAIILFSIYYASPETVYIIFTVLIIVYILGGFLLYLPFHFKMQAKKDEENWHEGRNQVTVVSTNFRSQKLTISYFWYFIPTLIIVLTVLFTFFMYDDIPNLIPMHTDFNGNVRYDTKSFKTLMYLPITQVFILFIMLGVHFIIGKSKQVINAENPDTSELRNILYRRKSSQLLLWLTILTELLMTVIQMSFIYPILEEYMNVLLGTFIALILGSTIIYALRVGQGGSRIKLSDDVDDGKIDFDHDKYWKLGQFYVNKNDPSIFVEKRFGVGWTCNWAHPLSWLFLIGVITIPILMTLLFI